MNYFSRRLKMKKTMILLAVVTAGIWILVLAYELFSAAGPATFGSWLGVRSASADTITSLDQVEPRTPISILPFTITESGSYYLTGNLSLAATDQNGIEVDANNVAIDLMGYSLIGAGGIEGISIEGKSNVEIRNGTVAYWEDNGIYEKGGLGHRIINVHLVWNSGSGIFLSGVTHTVTDCIATQNGGYGIAVADASILDRNSAFDNYIGIYVGSGCTVTNNSSQANWAAGMEVQSGCTVTGNTLDNNQWPDFLPPPTDTDSSTGMIVDGDGNAIRGNTLSGNPDTNILIKGTHNAVENNLVTGSQNGIYFDATGNFYANNRASQNTTNYRKAPASNSPGDGGGNAAF
jgi:parallel beta-helix repeat protein